MLLIIYNSNNTLLLHSSWSILRNLSVDNIQKIICIHHTLFRSFSELVKLGNSKTRLWRQELTISFAKSTTYKEQVHAYVFYTTQHLYDESITTYSLSMSSSGKAELMLSRNVSRIKCWICFTDIFN